MEAYPARHASPVEKSRVWSFLLLCCKIMQATKASPLGCCCNQSLCFPSCSPEHRPNGSADRRSATLSAGKSSAPASYPEWQLTVARWLDFSDNLFLCSSYTSALEQSCPIPDQLKRCELRWTQISSDMLYKHQICLHADVRDACACGVSLATRQTLWCISPLRTTWVILTVSGWPLCLSERSVG